MTCRDNTGCQQERLSDLLITDKSTPLMTINNYRKIMILECLLFYLTIFHEFFTRMVLLFYYFHVLNYCVLYLYDLLIVTTPLEWLTKTDKSTPFWNDYNTNQYLLGWPIKQFHCSHLESYCCTRNDQSNNYLIVPKFILVARLWRLKNSSNFTSMLFNAFCKFQYNYKYFLSDPNHLLSLLSTIIKKKWPNND